MLPVGNMKRVIFYTTFVPMGAMYLNMQDSNPMGAMSELETCFEPV